MDVCKILVMDPKTFKKIPQKGFSYNSLIYNNEEVPISYNAVMFIKPSS